jgi:hypothetical protein
MLQLNNEDSQFSNEKKRSQDETKFEPFQKMSELRKTLSKESIHIYDCQICQWPNLVNSANCSSCKAANPFSCFAVKVSSKRQAEAEQ